MRVFLAILACKLLRFVGKLVGKGSSLPGKYALKICPDILKRVELPAHIIGRKITNKNRDQAHETRIFAFFSLSKREREHPFPSSPSYDILHDRISHSSSQKGK